MRLRPRRRNLVVWSSTAALAGRSQAAPPRRGARAARLRRIRRRLRTGALLMVLGVLWLARNNFGRPISDRPATTEGRE